VIETKLFEVRDADTFIACAALLISGSHAPEASRDEWLASRAGYGEPMVIFGKLGGGHFAYDPHHWIADRTMHVAHKYIRDNWPNLESGAVVDVEFILGYKKKPKETERS
jgi:hypothetical protein